MCFRNLHSREDAFEGGRIVSNIRGSVFLRGEIHNVSHMFGGRRFFSFMLSATAVIAMIASVLSRSTIDIIVYSYQTPVCAHVRPFLRPLLRSSTTQHQEFDDMALARRKKMFWDLTLFMGGSASCGVGVLVCTFLSRRIRSRCRT